MKKGSILVSTSVLLGTVVVLSLMLISLNFFIYNRLNKDLTKERSLLEIQVAAQEILVNIDYEDTSEEQEVLSHQITFDRDVYMFTLDNDVHLINVEVNRSKEVLIWKVMVID
ncbi:MAG TPA: hypothetical protein GX708_19890 [Gallicola sp.]|nr:hypothetical protein [Gallicola sp.]